MVSRHESDTADRRECRLLQQAVTNSSRYISSIRNTERCFISTARRRRLMPGIEEQNVSSEGGWRHITKEHNAHDDKTICTTSEMGIIQTLNMDVSGMLALHGGAPVMQNSVT